MTTDTFEGWAIVELMGHRRLAGKVSEVEFAGQKMLRLDVPGADPETFSTYATQLYGGSAIYCLTPTDEATARAVAARSQPAPFQRWELPAAPQTTADELNGFEDRDAELVD